MVLGGGLASHPHTGTPVHQPPWGCWAPLAKGTLAAPGLPEWGTPELRQPTPHLAPATSDPQPCPKHTSTQGVAEAHAIDSLGVGRQGPAGAGTGRGQALGRGTRALGWRLRASIWLWCRRHQGRTNSQHTEAGPACQVVRGGWGYV